MAKETFSRYDTADYLKTEEDMTAYLDECVADGDPALIAAAQDVIARARKMAAKTTGKT